MPASRRASKLFSQNILQHLLVQARVRDKLLELAVFLLELLEATKFGYS
jgi:hypothetical protein